MLLKQRRRTPFQSYVWQEMLHAMSEVVSLSKREFDEILIRRMSEVFYEVEVKSLPPPPDVINYMMAEDSGFVPNGNSNAPFSEGMSGIEAERRLHQSDDKNVMDPVTHSITNSAEVRSEIPQPPVAIIPNIVGLTSSARLLPSQKPSLLGAPVRQDLSNQNSGQPPLLSRVPVAISSSSLQLQGCWLVEEDIGKAESNYRPSAIAQELDSLKSDKLRGTQNPFAHGASAYASSGFVSPASESKDEEALAGNDMRKQYLPAGEVGVSQNHVSSSSREFQAEAGKFNLLPSHLSIGVLQEIGQGCRSKVEFKSVVSTSKDLQFSVEVADAELGSTSNMVNNQQQKCANSPSSILSKGKHIFAHMEWSMPILDRERGWPVARCNTFHSFSSHIWRLKSRIAL